MVILSERNREYESASIFAWFLFVCQFYKSRLLFYWSPAFSDTLAAKKLALNRRFVDDRWSKHRCITCMDWSVQVTKLMCHVKH